MANIEINEGVWNGLSDADKTQVTESLKKNRLLLDGDSITGNPSVSAPAPGEEGFLGGFGFCKLACDVAAAASIAALTISGPALAAALVVIEAARRACRDAC
jgi:hypothetical protein